MGIAAGIAAGVGAVAAAGISAGVGAATAPDAPDFRVSGRDIGADPLVGLLTTGAFSKQGIADVAALGNASPLNQAFQAFRTGGFKNKTLLGNLPVFQNAIARITSGQTTLEQEMDVRNPPSGIPNHAKLFRKNIGFIAGLVNMTPEQLVQAQSSFVEQIDPLISGAFSTSEATLRGRNALLEKLASVSENFPTFDEKELSSLVALENARLDDQQRDILRTANLGNFNPGRALEGFERDRPLIALERALALQGGKQTLANQSAQSLLGIITPKQDIDLAAIRAGVSPATGATDPNPPNTQQQGVGSGIQDASGGIANMLFSKGVSNAGVDADLNALIANNPGLF